MKLRSKLSHTAIIIFFLVFSLQAKPFKISWNAGHLLLWDKTSIEGDVSYNWSAEMVLVRQADGRIRTFSANQVSQCSWFDAAQDKRRQFVSLLRPGENGRANQAFFELCVDGPLAVVRRLRQRHGPLKRLFRHPVYATDQPTLAKNSDQFDYFVWDAGRLLALNRFYADIYQPLMTAYDRELRHYVLTHNINDRILSGRLVLIDRYNSLVQKELKTASAKRVANGPE